MMKILLYVAHPKLEESRVNKRWIEEIEKNPGDVTIRRLYQEYPTMEIDVHREQSDLLAHDRIVFQFPFYWYSTPAILKQWQDAVLTYGWAYGEGGDRLRGKELILAISIGGPLEAYAVGGYNQYTIDELTRPLQAMANLTGMKMLAHFKLHGAGKVSDEIVAESAKQYARYITNTMI